MLKVEMFKLLAEISPLDNFLPFHCIPLMTLSPPFFYGIATYPFLASFEFDPIEFVGR